MALREINEQGRDVPVRKLPYADEFDTVWLRISPDQRAAIEQEIHQRLDRLIESPDPNWGSITNTSIEGGRPNPITGVAGDWSGTVFHPIFEAFAGNEEQAGMLYGNVWKKVINHPRLIHAQALPPGIRECPGTG